MLFAQAGSSTDTVTASSTLSRKSIDPPGVGDRPLLRNFTLLRSLCTLPENCWRLTTLVIFRVIRARQVWGQTSARFKCGVLLCTAFQSDADADKDFIPVGLLP